MNVKLTAKTLLIFSYFVFSLALTTHILDPCFTAAVYEHKRLNGNTPTDYELILQLNIDAYWNATKIAAKNGADIIVFPESGLFSPIEDRHLLKPFLEYIPNDGTNPCKEWTNRSLSVIRSLSCMAMSNDIYLSAHVGEIKDNFFSTSIIIDNKGIIIAKYNKYNLYFEPYYQKTSKPQIVVRSTQLGRLGIFICFDALHSEPISGLLKKKIDTLLYNTWWYDEMPFLTSSQEQFAISLTYDINLLSSGGNDLTKGTLGSSIFSRYSKIYTHDTKKGGSKLLISKIPKSKISKPYRCKKIMEIPIGIHKEENYNYLKLNLSIFKKIKLNKTFEQLKLCDKKFCCTIKYNTHYLGNTYYFILLKRIRHYLRICEEMCALVVYDNEKSTYQLTKGNIFKRIDLEGNFETFLVFPTVLTSDMKLVLKNWEFTKIKVNNTYISKMSLSNNNIPINVFGLYGRCFKEDPIKNIKNLPNFS